MYHVLQYNVFLTFLCCIVNSITVALRSLLCDSVPSCGGPIVE